MLCVSLSKSEIPLQWNMKWYFDMLTRHKVSLKGCDWYAHVRQHPTWKSIYQIPLTEMSQMMRGARMCRNVTRQCRMFIRTETTWLCKKTYVIGRHKSGYVWFIVHSSRLWNRKNILNLSVKCACSLENSNFEWISLLLKPLSFNNLRI